MRAFTLRLEGEKDDIHQTTDVIRALELAAVLAFMKATPVLMYENSHLWRRVLVEVPQS